jgi:ADP-L-glycero-D-manno-heptose 6-epimerase
VGSGKSQSFNDVANAVIDWHGNGAISYIPFPEGLREAYQSYTQADLAQLRGTGCDVGFRDVASGVSSYLDTLSG